MVRRKRFKLLKLFTIRTIARDLVLGLVFVITIVAGGFIGLNYLHISNQNWRNFEEKVDEYTSYLQGSLAAPIWNFDDESIVKIAESSLKNEIITGLRIEDYKHQPMYEAAGHVSTGGPEIGRSIDIRYRDKLAGRVVLTFSDQTVNERNRQLLNSSLLTLGIILLCLVSVTGLLLKVLVGKPIAEVHQAISRIGQGEYHLRSELPPQADIAKIIIQFNQMAEQIQLRENALTETNMRFNAILDNASAVFYLKDVQGRYLLVNRRYEELTGKDRESVLGRTDMEIFPKPAAELFHQNDRKVLAADAPIEFEETLPHADDPHVFLSVKFPLKDAEDQTYAICGISTDITRRKVAEQQVRKLNQELELRVERRTKALHQSNEQLKSEMAERQWAETALRKNEALLLATLESTADGVLVILSDHITLANQRFWQMWGFPAPGEQDLKIDTLRSHMRHLLEQPDGFREHSRRLYQSPEEALDILHLTDGRVFERYSCPLTIDRHNQGRVWCYRDISDKKQAEAAMAQAKDAAEAANQAKSDFLASMSHEIRTPMNGVMGMSGLLLETKLDKEQREYAVTIQNSAESLLTIINDILDFSKIEAGKLELETLDFDLAMAVEEVADMLAIGAYQKGLEIGSLIDENVPRYLSGDPGRLRQIIVNLASNAIKFTDAGDISIFVELADESETRAMLRFSIKDTGIGIPADRRDRLFKSFSQVDASTTRKFGGTGLGLAISRQLSHLLGGEIGVQSIEGEGSTFWFTARFEKQSRISARQPETPPSIAEKRILAVDDNAVNLKILSAYLSAWKCAFDTATDGAKALEELHRAAGAGKPYDMAIIDNMMPGMDGESLAAAIRADAKIGDLKLIRLSSGGSGGDAPGSKGPGFDASLSKPIKRDHLLRRILALFGHMHAHDDVMHQHQTSGASGVEDMKQRNIRVLVVEDNATNQKVVCHMLQKIGCHTDVAGNGAEAVHACSQIPYNLILMDVQMPVMDGLTATRKIRQLESNSGQTAYAGQSHTPIVALTANVMKGDREKCMDAGMDDFLPKPINPEALWQKINQWGLEAPRDDAAPGPEKASSRPGVCMDDTACFDLERALTRAMGDHQFLISLMDEFLESRENLLSPLAQAFAAEDTDALCEGAHALKGAAANLGATALAAAASGLEAKSRNQDLSDAAADMEQLRIEFDRLAACMQTCDRPHPN